MKKGTCTRILSAFEKNEIKYATLARVHIQNRDAYKALEPVFCCKIALGDYLCTNSSGTIEIFNKKMVCKTSTRYKRWNIEKQSDTSIVATMQPYIEDYVIIENAQEAELYQQIDADAQIGWYIINTHFFDPQEFSKMFEIVS